MIEISVYNQLNMLQKHFVAKKKQQIFDKKNNIFKKYSVLKLSENLYCSNRFPLS